MATAVAQYQPDCILFLGDGVRDIEELRRRFPDARYIILRGNCDPVGCYPDDAIVRLEDVGVFAVHGQNHGVKYGLDKFCTSVWCSGSKLGFYGHTHRPLWQEIRGMQIVNPGSIGSRDKPTFALVRIENGAADCRILDAPTVGGAASEADA